MKASENGTMPLVTSIATMLVMLMPAFAAERTWKGGGDTVAWSDGTNWEGGAAPSSGDSAVIPEGKTAVWSQTDASFMNALSGIKLFGDMEVARMTAATELTVPISGNGIFRGLEGGESAPALSTGTYYYLRLNNDNKDFTGTFAFTNCGVRIDHNFALGSANPRCTLIWKNDESHNHRRLSFNCGGVHNANMFLSQPNYSHGTIFGACYQSTYLDGDIDMTGPVSFHANGNAAGLHIRGKLTNSGKAAYKMFDHVHLEGEVDLQWSNESQFGGGFYLGGGNGNIKNMGRLYLNSSGVYFSAPNVFGGSKVGDMCYWLVGNGTAVRLYLKGNDQNWYRKSTVNTQGFIVNSTKPATMRMMNFGSANQTFNTADFLTGYVSFDVCATNATNGKYTTTVTNTHCTTAGGLLCGAGTFVVGDSAADSVNTSFSNLTSLVTYGDGKMKICNTDINPENGVTNLAVSGTSTMELGDGVTIGAVRADLSSTASLSIAGGSRVKVSRRTYLDGEELRPGVYGKVGGTYEDGSAIPAIYQLECLKGDGYLETNGRKGMFLRFE